jgi:hypothetical protein
MAEPLDTAAPEAPEAPEPVTTPDGRVYVRTKDGLASVPADQVETFVAEQRGTLATQADVEERATQREFGEGIGNEVLTGAESAADTATLGLYSLGRRALGGEEAARATRERRERSQLADTTGSLVGLGVSALATGGTSAIARAVPGAAALRAGMAAEEAIAGASALSRVGALTAAGTLEGAIFGIGEGISDAALSEDERDRMAEHLMVDLASRATEGALWGALGGAGGGVALEGLRGLAGTARKLAQRIPGASQGDEAAPTLLEGITRQTDELSDQSADLARAGAQGEADAGVDLAVDAGSRGRSTAANETTTTTSFRLGRPGEERNVLKEFGEAATARNRFDKVHQQATERITKLATDNARAADDMVAETSVNLKRHPVKAALQKSPPDSLDASTGAVLETLERVHTSISNAARRPEIYEKQGLRSFERAIEEIETIAGALRAPRDLDELTDVYIGMDRLKRRLGRIQKSAAQGANGDRGAQALLRDHYEELRALLEMDNVWGSGVSTLQKEVNASWSRYLDYANAYDQRFAFSQGLRTQRSARDGFEKIADADPAKIGSFLRGAGDVEATAAQRDLIEGARLQAELLDSLAKHYDVSEPLKAQAKQARKNAAEIAKEVENVTKVREQAQKWEEMISGLRDVPLVGTMLSGTIQTTGKAVASADSMARVVALARIKASAKSGAQALTGAVRSFVRRSSTATKMTARLAPSIVAKRAANWERLYSSIREYEKDPPAAVRRAYRAQHGIGTAAPLLAAAYAAKTNTAAQFLAERMPRHEPPETMFDRVDETKPPDVTDDELDTFLRYARAVENPLSIIEDLENLTVSPEAVEAIKAVYPALYQQLQVEILEQFSEAEKPPPYEVRLTLGTLFELTTDPSLDPEFLSMLQQSAMASMPTGPQGEPPLSPSRRSAPDTAGLAETHSQAFQRGP